MVKQFAEEVIGGRNLTQRQARRLERIFAAMAENVERHGELSAYELLHRETIPGSESEVPAEEERARALAAPNHPAMERAIRSRFVQEVRSNARRIDRVLRR